MSKVPNDTVGFTTGVVANDFTTSGVSWSNVDHIVSVAMTSSYGKMHIDGNTTEYTRNLSYGNTNGTDGYICRSPVSEYWDGSIQDILIFDTEITDVATRQKIEGYLAAKWNQQTLLPANHPYKTVSPTP
jgi:hypothetical protein